MIRVENQMINNIKLDFGIIDSELCATENCDTCFCDFCAVFLFWFFFV